MVKKVEAMATDVELNQRLREHSEVIKFAQEVLDVITSGDLQQEARKSADTVNKIRSKISKAKENTQKSIQGKATPSCTSVSGPEISKIIPCGWTLDHQCSC